MLWEWQIVDDIEDAIFQREFAFGVLYENNLEFQDEDDCDCDDCSLKKLDFLISNSDSQLFGNYRG